MGDAPDWWFAFEAAPECNAPVWDVAGLPETAGHHFWIEWALIRRVALANAREELRIKAEMVRG